jgi:glutathione S-transferase
MITVHHLGISQSERIVWLCEELNVPYELKRYDRDSTTRLAPAEYKALHPFGTAPVITDGALVLGESGAIMEYIIHKYGSGRLALSPDHANYPDYLYWLHFANASLMPLAMGSIGRKAQDDSPVQQARARTLAARDQRAYDMMESHLGKNDYFAGSMFTAADIIMLFPLTTMRVFAPRDLSPNPNIRAYVKRIAERPAYQRAMQKADPGVPRLLE